MLSATIEPASIDMPLTHQLCADITALLSSSATPYEACKQIAASYLGISVLDATIGRVQFGFWMPGLKDNKKALGSKQFFLELFTALEPYDYQSLSTAGMQRNFLRQCLTLQVVDDFYVGVVDGVKLGTKEAIGTLYWLRGVDKQGQSFIVRDPLTQSVPFGIYGPAEVLDMKALFAQRKDGDYFTQHYKHRNEDASYRAKDIGTTLEIHTETATEEGTINALTETYRSIAEKISQAIAQDTANSDPYRLLNPAEKHFVAFDTVELTPEVPPVEREQTIGTGISEFFNVDPEALGSTQTTLAIRLRKPDISDWGYDTPIIGTGAINPSLLRTGRPHEFLEFVETLHTFPTGPIQISLDAVLGHADFQGAFLLQTFDYDEPVTNTPLLKYHHSAYFTGPNLYGRDINYKNPMVRAILLEMYARKLQFGFDCVRVDGGQDFIQSVDPVTGYRVQDDPFIHEMVSMPVSINGITRRLDMNVEDGRPWPNDLNWLYNATYLEHVLGQSLPGDDQVKQWGSLIFAHNVHGKFKWFLSKWDRFKDTFKDGEVWITGHSNHDNARYYYRLVYPTAGSDYQDGDSFDTYYNEQEAATLKETTHRTLDHTGLSALVLAFLPGNPMFFLNCLYHAPWLFFRDIDDHYGLKVVADEGSRFLTWYIDEATYTDSRHFKRLKKLGFTKLDQLVAPSQSSGAGFLDVLFEKHEKIKTDPVAVLSLFDCPDQKGRFSSVKALQAHAEALLNPSTDEQKQHLANLKACIAADPQEAERKYSFATGFIAKSLLQLEQELSTSHSIHDKDRPSLTAQHEKLLFLQKMLKEGQKEAIALLLEDAYAEDAYDLAAWGKDPVLCGLAPLQLLAPDKTLTVSTLKAFALAFMQDARDVAKLHHWKEQVAPDRSAYNLALRQFRKAHPWLAKNPTNNPRLDFFNRKIIPNGAKDLGAFFSDKGDIINANTIYYGWRTSPEAEQQGGRKQILFVANMEGKPLHNVAMSQFLPVEPSRSAQSNWKVVLKSPQLALEGSDINASTVLKQLAVGDTLLLERMLP